MDMIVASPNGGLYAPTLQSLIHSSLERVRGYLSSADTSSADHKHHLSTADDRKREQARCDEYRHWFERDGGWAGEPGFGPSWRFTNASEGLDAVCDLMTPTRVDDEDDRDDKALSDQVDKWRAGLEGLRGNYAPWTTSRSIWPPRGMTRNGSVAPHLTIRTVNGRAVTVSTVRSRPPSNSRAHQNAPSHDGRRPPRPRRSDRPGTEHPPRIREAAGSTTPTSHAPSTCRTI